MSGFWTGMARLRWLVVLCFGWTAGVWFLVGLATGNWLPYLIAGGTIVAGSFLLYLMRPLKPGDE